jgi:hypothetical protein
LILQLRLPIISNKLRPQIGQFIAQGTAPYCSTAG